MADKGIRGRICHSINRYTKTNNKHLKDYDKSKESLYIQYWDANNLYGWEILQKLPVNGLEWVENILNLIKIWWKGIMKKKMKDICLKLMLSILKIKEI